MDVRTLERLDGDLRRFFAEFDGCFSRSDTRKHLSTYCGGQLSDLPAKSVEPIALAAGVAPRTLQEFLAQHRWNEDLLREKLYEIVVRDHAGPNSIAIFDETSDVKKGDKTPGVQRQWCGKVGKTENCLVAVHLAYARGDFHCLLDGELFLPKSWSADRERCREAGIPDSMVHRPKWEVALELYDRARAAGVEFAWATADEGYGGKPGFLEGLSLRGQKYVVEVPKTCSVFPRRPRVATRTWRKSGPGRARTKPRIQSGEPEPRSVERHLWFDSAGKAAKWKRFHVKDSHKGPVVWEAKRTRVVLKLENGLPGPELWMIAARNLLSPDEMKFFLADAPETERFEPLLLAAFSRWRVERAFEDQKQEVGLDCWEGRRYLGLKRHLILTSVSYLFLAASRERLRGGKPGADDPAAAGSDGDARPLPRGARAATAGDVGGLRGEDPLAAGSEPLRPRRPRPHGPGAAVRRRPRPGGPDEVPLGR